MISRAEATYTDGSKTVTVDISDPGGASGLIGLASWATLQTSKEDDNGSERMSKVNGRMVHEQTWKNGADEYAMVLGDALRRERPQPRDEVDQLKAMVSALDLNKTRIDEGCRRQEVGCKRSPYVAAQL